MYLPSHPFWFWLILVSPVLIWTALWAIARYVRVSLKPIKPWLTAGTLLSFPAFILLVSDGHKTLRLAVEAVFYTCMIGSAGIGWHYSFEILRGPRAKWYMPWSSARFSIPQNARIFVRSIASVAPWYVDKLGLRKSAESPWAESDAATYRFKEDGKSITLTTKTNYGIEKTLILFTKRIGRMKHVLSARGIDVGPLQQDRQGTRYFEIYDPEGNAIEVVEEP